MDIINKVLLGAGTAAVFALFWLSLANAHLKTQLAEARTDVFAYRMANDDFAATLERQNKAVAQLKADSARREKRAQEAADAAQEKARLFFIAADKLRKTMVHGDACTAANSLLDAYLGDNK
jgi:hypothetical protein